MKHKLMMTRKFEEKNLMYKPFRIYSVNIADINNFLIYSCSRQFVTNV